MFPGKKINPTFLVGYFNPINIVEFINPTFLIGYFNSINRIELFKSYQFNRIFFYPEDLGRPKINSTFLIGQINPTNLVGLPKNPGISLEAIF